LIGTAQCCMVYRLSALTVGHILYSVMETCQFVSRIYWVFLEKAYDMSIDI